MHISSVLKKKQKINYSSFINTKIDCSFQIFIFLKYFGQFESNGPCFSITVNHFTEIDTCYTVEMFNSCTKFVSE